MDDLTRLFDEFDRGTISRRQLFQALGLVAAAAPFVPLARAFGQGQCAGRDRDTTAACNKTPFKAPFEPTGWKTVLLDHFNMQVTDAEREAAFYAAFLGWKVRSNDGNEIYMDIGDWGGVKIRGGYVPPARGRVVAVAVAGAAVAVEPPGGGATGGRGGGGGGGRGRRRWWPRRRRWPRDDPSHMAACTTPRVAGVDGGGALWDGFCWGIEPWDTNKVEAALKARGLNPVADHSGDDFRSFHVKDPDGMDVRLSNGNKKNRRQRRRRTESSTLRCRSSRRAGRRCISTTSRIQCTSYKETVAFYEALLGWKGLGDEGSQNETEIAPEIGGLLIRGGNATSRPTFMMPAQRSAVMNHISFGISPFDRGQDVGRAVQARAVGARRHRRDRVVAGRRRRTFTRRPTRASTRARRTTTTCSSARRSRPT